MLGERTFCQLLDFYGKLAYCHQVQLISIPPRGVTRMAMNIFYAKSLLQSGQTNSYTLCVTAKLLFPKFHCIPLRVSTVSYTRQINIIDNKRCYCALTILAVWSNNLDNLAHEQKKIYNEIYGLGGYITVYSSAAMETECHQSVT